MACLRRGKVFTTMKKATVTRVARHIVLIAGASIVVVPFLWMITTALQTRAETYTNSSVLPTSWHWENFAKAWAAARFSICSGRFAIRAG